MAGDSVSTAKEFFAHSNRLDAFEGELFDLAVSFESLGWDEYDGSLELYGVSPEFRMPEPALKFIFESGFRAIFVNHTDKWETHYSTMNRDGWRVSYPSKRGPDEQGILVERKIASWPQEWFDSGYVKVVTR